MDKLELLLALQEKKKRKDENALFYKYFQPNTPLSIEHYKKQYEFFQKGMESRIRVFIGGNRIGKTKTGGYELSCHAINWYPNWWCGKRFEEGKNITIWVAGNTRKTTRDILQKELLGDLSNIGTGLIPKKYIDKYTKSSGTAESIDTIYVNRIGGGIAKIVFKSYDSGRTTFEGESVDFILLDEEPPLDVYVECILRTMTTNGIIGITFTPLKGLTPLIDRIMQESVENSSKSVIRCEWEDVPHLTEKQKAEILAETPEWLRDARSKGIPQLGSGSIYRVPLDEILVDDFEIPEFWPRVYSLDVGWNKTACLWGAINPETNVVYLYDEMYESNKQPYEYARTIKTRGDWLPGVVDSASNNSNQHDGTKIYELLIAEGLNLVFPDKAVEAGLLKTWEHLTLGKLKVFKRLKSFQEEYRLYRRNDLGKIVKEKDHLMDCMRYLIMSGVEIAKTKPVNKPVNRPNIHKHSWLG